MHNVKPNHKDNQNYHQQQSGMVRLVLEIQVIRKIRQCLMEAITITVVLQIALKEMRQVVFLVGFRIENQLLNPNN